MKAISFSNMKAMLLAALSLGAQYTHSPLERLFSGQLMTRVGRTTRRVSPQQWLHEYMASANPEVFAEGFERAPKRSRNVGYVRRQGPNLLRIARPNYAKAIRRAVRALELNLNVASTGPEINKRLAAYGMEMRRG